MLQAVRDLTREYDMLPAGGRVLCALSGGADSMCLAHLLLSLSDEGGFTVAAAHYNHRLRGTESDRDEAFVRAWCAEHGVPLLVGSGDVGGEAKRLGRGVEETARRLRYAFLRAAAEELGCVRIATAHNADDNAETLLLHLIRGSGLQGLTGIAPRRGEVVRPLLTVTRAQIEAYAAEHSLPYVEDSTNADTAYTRNKLRHTVMPLLRELNPRLTESLSDTARYLRVDNDFLNAQAAAICRNARWAEDNIVIEAHFIASAPNAVAPRAARRLLEMMGDGDIGSTEPSSRGDNDETERNPEGPLGPEGFCADGEVIALAARRAKRDTNCSAAHLNAIVDLCRGEDPSAVCFLPNNLLAQRVYRELLLTTREDAPGPFEPVALREGENPIPGTDWTVVLSTPPPPGLVARSRRLGDELTLPRRGTKTIKKLFIDEKIPRRERERIPVVADEGGVLAVAGFGMNSAHQSYGKIEITCIRNREKDG